MNKHVLHVHEIAQSEEAEISRLYLYKLFSLCQMHKIHGVGSACPIVTAKVMNWEDSSNNGAVI